MTKGTRKKKVPSSVSKHYFQGKSHSVKMISQLEKWEEAQVLLDSHNFISMTANTGNASHKQEGTVPNKLQRF